MQNNLTLSNKTSLLRNVVTRNLSVDKNSEMFRGIEFDYCDVRRVDDSHIVIIFNGEIGGESPFELVISKYTPLHFWMNEDRNELYLNETQLVFADHNGLFTDATIGAVRHYFLTILGAY